MAIVSSDPGGSSGALGVITLEDVIEELIGEVSFQGFQLDILLTKIKSNRKL